MGVKPKLLDLFCKAGGASMGYHRAGFEVVGVDIESQPRYPFEFIYNDAMRVLELLLAKQKLTTQGIKGRQYGIKDFDAFHASPPCQAFTSIGDHWRQKGYKYPDYISATRELLKATGKPYIIENVPGSPLINPTALSGPQFNLGVIRRRHFETSFEMPLVFMVKPSGTCQNGEYVMVCGHASVSRQYEDYRKWPKAMGIDWMNKKELAQAIPPAYTEFIGKHLIRAVMELGI